MKGLSIWTVLLCVAALTYISQANVLLMVSIGAVHITNSGELSPVLDSLKGNLLPLLISGNY